MQRSIKAIHVRAIRASATAGIVVIGHLAVSCALGHSGTRALKREGDGATPAGRWRFGTVLRRPDRTRPLNTALCVKLLRLDMGWCDDPGDRNYNRAVRLPYPASHEKMWRADGLYDIVMTLSHNMRPRIAGLGSAVFFHLASPGLGPTAGCVAVSARDMRRILPYLGHRTELVVGRSDRPTRDGRKLPTRPAGEWRHRQ